MALALKSHGYSAGIVNAPKSHVSSDGKPSPLLNYNCSTAIGLGDEPAGILDQFGQLRGRNVQLLLDLDSPLMPFQHEKWIAEDRQWAQWLDSGCLPIVRSKLSGGRVSVDWTAFSSDHGGVKGDYVAVSNAAAPLRLRLLFPYASSVKVEGRTGSLITIRFSLSSRPQEVSKPPTRNTICSHEIPGAWIFRAGISGFL